MPLCWIFLLKRRSALSKVSFSPTRTSANREITSCRRHFCPTPIPGPDAGAGARRNVGLLADSEIRTALATRGARAGGVYASLSGRSTVPSEVIEQVRGRREAHGSRVLHGERRPIGRHATASSVSIAGGGSGLGCGTRIR